MVGFNAPARKLRNVQEEEKRTNGKICTVHQKVYFKHHSICYCTTYSEHPELSIILILSALVDGILYSQSVTLSTMVHWTGCVQYE